MKLRFSLRMLLACTVAAAAAAAFVALRSQPARVAERFQAAARQGDWNAAAAMIDGADLKQTLDQPQAHAWEIESVECRPQSVGQWLRGECLGKLAVTSHSSGESDAAFWSSYQTSRCDIAVTARGVRIVTFTKDEPLVAGAPKPPYESADPDQPAND